MQDFDTPVIKRAMAREDAPEWKLAVIKEHTALLQQKVWEVVHPPADANIVTSKWVLKIKRLADGSVDKYKARLVARGFTQQEGKDFFEVFAPVGRHTTLRALIAHAVIQDLDIEQSDVSTAYLQSDLQEDVYLRLPEGVQAVKVSGETTTRINTEQLTSGAKGPIVKLRKSLYGLHQSGRNWHRRFHEVLSDIGLQRSKVDPCFYTWSKGEHKLWMVIFVDDMVFTGSPHLMDQLKGELSKQLKVEHRGELRWVLGLELIRDRQTRTANLRQSKYIEDMLTRFNMNNCNPVGTPIDPKQRLTSTGCLGSEGEDGKDEIRRPYASLVGSLLYAAICTRPDIAFAVGECARFMAKPGQQHWGVAKRILRYLQATKQHGLAFGPDTCGQASDEAPRLTAYGDSDFAADLETRRSTTGFITRLGGSTLSWASKRQRSVTLSTTEAEYMAAGDTLKEVKYLKQLLDEIDPAYAAGTTTLYCDNQGAVLLGNKVAYSHNTRHIDTRAHAVREAVEQGAIDVQHVPSAEMLADTLTKGVNIKTMVAFRAAVLTKASPAEAEGTRPHLHD